MKIFSRSTLFLSLVSILCFGLFLQSFPPKVASAAGNPNATENSGGFIVQAQKVEGSMNPVAMAAGVIDMGEGKIYGLTITKKLEKSNPAIIIKIKSPGPIPVKNLKGKLMGLPQFSSPCLPSQIGWLCLNDVKMKLSEQTVGSISLPNATIETCFEGQCDAVDPNIDGKELGEDKGKNLGSTITDLTKQLDQLNKIIDQTKQLQDVITKGKDTLQQLIKKAEDAVGLPDQLESLTKQIGDGYQQLADNLNKLLPLLGNSDQLLSQITDAINKGDPTQLTKDLTDNLQSITDKTKDLQNVVNALKDKQLGNTDSLNGIKEGVNRLKETITKNKEQFSGNQLNRILENLGADSFVEKIVTTAPILPPTSSTPTAPTTPPPPTGDTSGTGATTGGTGGNGGTTGGAGGTGGTTTDGGTGGEDPTANLEKQLADTIEDGRQLANSIQAALNSANSKMDEMDQLSGSLIGVNLLLIHILNKDKADQYQADLDDVKGYVNAMAGPVQQLKDTISKAEALQSQLGQTSSGLQELNDALGQVGTLESRLKSDLKNKLISLPLLNTIQLFIDQLDELTKEMDGWDI